MPRAVSAAGGFGRQRRTDAAFAQFGKSLAPSLPLLPQHRTQSAPQPRLKIAQHARGLAEAEIAVPTSQVGGQLLHHALDAHPARAARQFPYSPLEACNRLRCNPPPWRLSTCEAEAQELSLPPVERPHSFEH